MKPVHAWFAALTAAWLLALPVATRGDAFDAALAACARVTEACEKTSYAKDLCDQARKGLPDCDENTGTGVLCKLKVQDIAPTQVAVGAHVAKCKAEAKFARDKDKIRRYLLRSGRHIPTVIGPENAAGKRFYITDHHHLSYALLLAHQSDQTDVDTLYACILTNRNADESDSFWKFMVSNRFAWLNDPQGKAITTAELEDRAPDLENLEDDPYRSWSRWVRDSCGYLKAGKDCVPSSYPAQASYFMEFKWASYLRENLPGHDDIGTLSDEEIAKTLRDAVATAQGPQAFLEDLPGYSDGTLVPVKYVDIEKRCEAD
jgi:hypothetical protein